MCNIEPQVTDLPELYPVERFQSDAISAGLGFAMATSIFAGTVEKTGNYRQKPSQKPIFCGSGRLHYFNIIK